MNKKYMDFVPAKPKGKGSVRNVVVEKKVVKSTPKVASKAVQKTVKSKKQEKIEEVQKEKVILEDSFSIGAETFSLKKEPNYGVIEDFRPKFVKTEVEKRPLSHSHFTSEKSVLSEAKSKKVGMRGVEKPVEKVKETGKNGKDSEDKAKMKIPKSPFINQTKVPKRPLSKNVYERKVEPTKEKMTGPVTIIAKPEKDSKVSLVVTIILTIILGAAAGTIAFLLLPK